MPKPKRMTDLVVKEISAVKRPANRRKILVIKSDNTKDQTMPETQPSDTSVHIDAAWASPEQRDAVRAYVAKRAGDVTEEDNNAGFSPQAAVGLRALGRVLSQIAPDVSMADIIAVAERVGVEDSPEEYGEDDEDEGAPDAEQVELSKAAEPEKNKVEEVAEEAAEELEEQAKELGQSSKEDADEANAKEIAFNEKGAKQAAGGKVGKSEDTAHDVEVTAENGESRAGAAAEADTTTAAIAKAAKGNSMTETAKAGGQDYEAVLKSNSDLQEQMRVLIQKSEAREAELKAEVAAERNIRVLKSIKEEVQTDLRHLTIDADKLATVLKSVRETEGCKDHADTLLQVLKAANTQVASASTSGGGLFGSIGTMGSVGETSAEAQLNAMVDATVAKGEGKSRAKIYRDLITKSEDGKRLYKAYLNESKGN